MQIKDFTLEVAPQVNHTWIFSIGVNCTPGTKTDSVVLLCKVKCVLSGTCPESGRPCSLIFLRRLDAAKNKIKVLMSTNRIDILDPALLWPGRIDRKIEFPNPNEASRADILKIHSRRMNLTWGIDSRKIANVMGGASGAELKACCTEVGMFALRERRVHVTQEDFEMARPRSLSRTRRAT